jgi:hypothetical protein
MLKELKRVTNKKDVKKEDRVLTYTESHVTIKL